MNKIAFIDLSNNEIKYDVIPDSLRKKVLGGRGINMWLLNALLPQGIKPLSPDNLLIVGCGLFSGMEGPSFSRLNISGKSPETGFLGDSNIGGHFSSKMRRAGFSHLVIRGASEKPVILVLENGEVRIEAAHELWGKDCTESHYYLQKKYGDRSASLMIGPAGEKLVKFACIRSDLKSTAGRTGLGALMGSKKLKAIVAVGNQKLPINYSTEYRIYCKKLREKITETRVPVILSKSGTPYLYDLHYLAYKISRVLNGTASRYSGGKNLMSKVLIDKYYRPAKPCFSCYIGCRHSYVVPKEDGTNISGEGPEYATVGTFGPSCGINSIESILMINEKLNRLGLDVSSTGNLIAWAMELFEKKIIDDNDTGGLSLNWGNSEAVLTLIDQIALREGFGKILALGAKEAAEIIGRNSEQFLIWCKNLPQSDPVDLRYYKGFALGVGISTRGADHLRSRPTFEVINLSEDVIKSIYGISVGTDGDSYNGKAAMVGWSENFYAVADSLGICKFILKFNSPYLLGYEEISELIGYLTSLNLSVSDLEQIGRNIIALERIFIVREGVTPRHDWLPERYYKPLESDCGSPYIDTEMYAKMLEEYYDYQDINPVTGAPKFITSASLGILNGCTWGKINDTEL